MTLIEANGIKVWLRDDFAQVCIQEADRYTVLHNDYHDGHHFNVATSEAQNWKHPNCCHRDQLRPFEKVQWLEVRDADENTIARLEF